MKELALGQKIGGRYELTALLGKGASSQVYEALDHTEKKELALKLFLDSTPGINFIQHEFRFLSSLRHPNLIQVFDFGRDNNYYYFTMELMPGQSILDCCQGKRVAECSEKIAQLCRALEYIHEHDVVHLDIKPSNILISGDGTVKLSDFGLARRFTGQSAFRLFGTPAYMSPEIIASQVPDGRSDLYSLGVLMYQVFTGKLPFEAVSTEELIRCHLQQIPQPPQIINPEISNQAGTLILKLLSKDPNDRPNSANEVITEINRILMTDLPLEAELNHAHHVFFSRLMGRDKELTELRQAMQNAAAGQGSCLFISGEAGIGRTRLVSEFALQAQLLDAQVFWSRCYQQDTAAFHPLIQLMHQLLPLAQSFNKEVLASYGNELVELLPDIKTMSVAGKLTEPSRLPSVEKRLRLLDAVTTFITTTLESLPLKPAVLIFEGMHWADRESLEAIYHLGRNIARSPILIVITFRSEDVDQGHALLKMIEQLGPEGQAGQIYLRRLSKSEVAALIANVLPRADNLEPLAAKIYAETEGNPFQIEEAVYYLLESGQIRRKHGQWQIDAFMVESLSLPSSISQATERKLKNLSADQLKILQAMAVLGRPAPEQTIAQMTGLAVEPTSEDLIHLKGRNLLAELDRPDGPVFGLHHAKIQDLIAGAIEDERRKQLHLNAAGILERAEPKTYQDYIDLARHWMQAGNQAKAREYHLRTAVELKDYARDQAIEHYRAALELSPGPERLDILAALQELYFITGDHTAAESTVAEIIERQGPSAELLRLRGAIQERQGAYDAALQSFQQALELAGADQEATARIEAAIAQTYIRRGEYHSAEKACQNGIKILPRDADPQVEAELYNSLGQVYWHLAEWAQAIAVHQKSLALKEKFGDLYGIATSCNNLGMVYYRMYEWDKAEEFHQKSFAIREQIGDISGLAKSYNNLALIYRHLYDWNRAMDYHAKCLRIMERIGSSYEIAVSHTNLGFIHKARGEWDQALWSYNRAVQIALAIGAKNVLLDTYIKKAEVYLSLGTLEDAALFCQKAMDLANELGGRLELGRGINIQGRIYQMRRQWDRAMESLSQARDIFSQLDIKAGEAFILKNMADLHREQGELDRSEKLAAKALILAQRVEEQQLASEILLLQGELADERGEGGLKYMEWAMELAVRVGNRETIAAINAAMARHHVKGRRYAQAVECCQRAVAVYKHALKNISQPELKSSYLFEPRRRQALRDIKKLRQEAGSRDAVA
ncbi:MAG: tetratricopeptide repeat protein [Candidatus Edwardsbacteria bacterium]|nr:tetratricopeptide repeat protein [Candidatus Edwardsbacteria bacterium]